MAVKARPRPAPKVGSYWVIGKCLFYVVLCEKDVIYVEECVTEEIQQMRRVDWAKVARHEVKR